MYESILARGIRWVGVYAVALMPLVIFSEYLSPFHFGKVVLFRTVVELIFPFYLALIVHDRSYLPRFHPLVWAVLGFAGAFSLTTLISSIPYFSFWGTLERMGGLLTLWHFVVFFIMMLGVLRTFEQWRQFLTITLAAGLLSALYGFGQKTHSGLFIGASPVGQTVRERIFGTIGNPALFAGYQLMVVFLALSQWGPAMSRARRIFLGSVVVCGSLAVMMTVVRGSLLGFGIGLAVVAVLLGWHLRVAWARRFSLTLAVGAVLFGLFLGSPLQDSSWVRQSRFLSRISDTSFEAYTAKTRFWAWQAGLEGWAERPRTMVFGWGPENFNIPFSRHFNPKFFNGPGSETYFDRGHNMFVEVLVTMGLVGIVAYIGLFFVLFRTLWRILRANDTRAYPAICLIGLTVTYLIHNLFIFDTAANYLVLFTILGYVVFLDRGGEEQSVPAPIRRAAFSGVSMLTALVLLPIMLVMVYRVNIRPAQANYASTRAIVAGWNNRSDIAIPKFEEAVDYDTFGVYDIRHRFAQYVLEQANGISAAELPPPLSAAVDRVIAELQKSDVLAKIDYLPKLYLARLYITLGRVSAASPANDTALQYAQAAYDLSPTFIRTYYEIAQVYLNKKDYARAVGYFQQAVALNPEVGISLWYLGSTQIQAGQVSAGWANLQLARTKGYVPTNTDFTRVLSVFISQSNWPYAIDTLEQLIDVYPQDVNSYLSLGAIYRQVGRIDDAIETAIRMAQANPSTTATAKKFVQELGGQWPGP